MRRMRFQRGALEIALKKCQLELRPTRAIKVHAVLADSRMNAHIHTPNSASNIAGLQASVCATRSYRFIREKEMRSSAHMWAAVGATRSDLKYAAEQHNRHSGCHK